MIFISKINILSLFDGISCGQIALNRANIPYDNYYASEIYPEAIKITKNNYPNTIQLGDVTKINTNTLEGLPKIDLLIGGSPCQNLSVAVINNKEHNQGLKGDKSMLFYEYIRVLKWLKQNNNQNIKFLLENVGSMQDKDRDIMTKILGTEPLRIDSNLVSPQDRDRYYWTNIDVKDMPSDKGLMISDIALNPEDVDYKYWYHDKTYELVENWEDKKIIGRLNVNSHDIGKRIYNLNNKCATLTACRGGYRQKKIIQNDVCRKLTPLEYERLQTVPDGYTEGVADIHRYNTLGDGWTIDIIAHIFKYIDL